MSARPYTGFRDALQAISLNYENDVKHSTGQVLGFRSNLTSPFRPQVWYQTRKQLDPIICNQTTYNNFGVYLDPPPAPDTTTTVSTGCNLDGSPTYSGSSIDEADFFSEFDMLMEDVEWTHADSSPIVSQKRFGVMPWWSFRSPWPDPILECTALFSGDGGDKNQRRFRLDRIWWKVPIRAVFDYVIYEVDGGGMMTEISRTENELSAGSDVRYSDYFVVDPPFCTTIDSYTLARIENLKVFIPDLLA